MIIVGILNSNIASLVARSGHMDEIIVCDAGFPIPLGVETIDLALSAGHPDVLEVLEELVRPGAGIRGARPAQVFRVRHTGARVCTGAL